MYEYLYLNLLYNSYILKFLLYKKYEILHFLKQKTQNAKVRSPKIWVIVESPINFTY